MSVAKNAPQLPYTVKQVAEMYGVCAETIRREISAGRLKAAHKRGQRRIWYITEANLNDWAENMLEEDGL